MRELTAGLLIAAVLALMVYCLVETVEAPRSRVRRLPVRTWQVLLLVPVAGPLAWLLLGRPRAGHRIDMPAPGGTRRRPARWEDRMPARRAGHAAAGSLAHTWPAWPLEDAPQVIGPDDDPAFIAHLAALVQRQRDGGRPTRTDDGDDPF